ncbi:methylmalonyl-CoA epimerase [Chloroherpeton thalassium ATCC 35110]|uniref:Methylmalonyl-CoA epimerase n=1 Tax=Chloroherpeton thalassium (strain ATCC 35110 / GB-78) TaxID=517418 RepID=B3QVA6_CHLT3|nr:methylmalonyl-CoA epimerase [Chloroherpeton thalassium]ACF13060.1 methylmalonyl-CoA epimerase [Chloroherpeton thalassium ATCC 35110]
MFKRIDHVAIAVNSIDATLATFKQLVDEGVASISYEEVPAQKVKVAFLQIGDTKIEFLEPMAPDSTVSKYLEKRGEGLHHIALETDEIHNEVAGVKARGFNPLSDPRLGAENKLVTFLHPKETGRVLVELVGQEASKD